MRLPFKILVELVTMRKSTGCMKMILITRINRFYEGNTTKIYYLQFRMSEMKTAKPRIPSPRTAGIVTRDIPHQFDSILREK